jgi:hypothetical protein
MNYRELVVQHLQTLRVRGLTNQQIADKLGLAKGNYVSMLMKLEESGTVLALKRLPDLQDSCGFNDYEALRLWFKLAKDGHASEWDAATFRWYGKILMGALHIYKARKSLAGTAVFAGAV